MVQVKDDVASEAFATVRQPFFGTDVKQLNVARGDLVTIKERSSVWCTVRHHGTGRVGLVPTAYINVPPAPGTKRPSKAAVIARLTQQSQKDVDTGLLNHAGVTASGSKEYWRTIAVPLEAHIAAARKGLFVPEGLQGAREFFSTHGDMREKLVKPAPARCNKLSQLATPRGGAASQTADQSPQPPSGRKPVLGTPRSAALSYRARPSPRQRLRSLKGSESARPAIKSRPQEFFAADTYVGQATVTSLRTQMIDRTVNLNVPAEGAAQSRSAEALVQRLSERDIDTAEEAAERKQRLEEEQFAAQFSAQLALAKRELHSER